MKDIIKEVQFPKPKPSRSWADTGDKALNFKVTKYVQWIANFGIWKWCREPGDRHQRAGDNDDGPTPAPWSGPEEFDTNINRSPGPRAQGSLTTGQIIAPSPKRNIFIDHYATDLVRVEILCQSQISIIINPREWKKMLQNAACYCGIPFW